MEVFYLCQKQVGLDVDKSISSKKSKPIHAFLPFK